MTDGSQFGNFVRRNAAWISRTKLLPENTATRMAVYLGNNRALTKTVYGHKIYVDTRDHSLTPHILLDGNWEDWITKVFRTVVRDGMRVIDVGANIGWYSLIAGDLVGAAGRVTSFEADPEMAEILYRNIVVNGLVDRVTVVPKAVYSESKPVEFKIHEHLKGSSSLFSTDASAAVFNDEVSHVTVQATAIDDFLPENSVVDFMKIDAEGAEPFVLQGARRTLSENRDIQIMMEFSPAMLCAYGSAETFLGEISGLGFGVWRIAADSSLIRSSHQDLLSAGHCDVLLRRS
ncbi:FkbM family methyltransferase [Aestuariivirga sp.]|uniref:FkbM family methyltransferase n=1 Tax=Aestuariivirga sp. TaxID=2650926 RepID=UPI0037832AD2